MQRNAAALPLYVLALGADGAARPTSRSRKGVLPVGFNPAKGQVGDLNTITPLIFHQLFPAWCAGIAYATLVVAALIPAAVMSISAANLFTRSIYREYFRPRASSAGGGPGQPWASLLVKFGAVGFIFFLDPTFSAEFQLIGGVIMLQTLPAVFFGLLTGWFHRRRALRRPAGRAGPSVVMLYQIPQLSSDGKHVVKAHFGGSTWPLSLLGGHSTASIYVGFVTVLVNLLVVVVGTVLLQALRVPAGLDATRPEDYLADADDPSLARLDYLLDGVPEETGAHAAR